MYEPTEEEVIDMLEQWKKRFERALDHINKEIERLREQKPEEDHHHE